MSKVKYGIDTYIDDKDNIIYRVHGREDGDPKYLGFAVGHYYNPDEAQAMLRGLLIGRGDSPEDAAAATNTIMQDVHQATRKMWRKHYLARTRSNGHKETTP